MSLEIRFTSVIFQKLISGYAIWSFCHLVSIAPISESNKMEETAANNKTQEDIEKMLVRSELIVKSIGSMLDEAYILWDKFQAKLITWVKIVGLFEEKEDEIYAVKKDKFKRKKKIRDECYQSMNSSDRFEIEMNRLFDLANKTSHHGGYLINKMNGMSDYIETINSLIGRVHQEKLTLKQKREEEITELTKILKEKDDEIALLKIGKSCKASLHQSIERKIKS